ncbi:MAG: right-handed parallel beta-helix repeat-containing protein, partial [Candidatus Micrarchaeota archaeon]|nr:right-handed parallel beta-helix repeat-containing protein [Candidatus Micrarchaeota archaeon]
SNMSTTLTNNTLTNITWTYSQDYSVLKWAVQCCNSTNSCNMTANRTLRIDTTPPVTTATAKKNDSSTYTFNTWTNSTYVNVTLICDDTGGSGCSTTKYCNDTTNTCTPSTTYSSPVRITTQGTSYIRYNSTDSAGNIEAIKNQTIMIDSTAPVTTATAVKNDSSSYIFGTATNSSYVNVTLSCSDGETGCNITKYCTDTNNTCTPSTTYSSPVQISTQGISYIRYNSTDNLGNNEAIKSKTIIIDSTPPIYSSNSTNSTFAATPVIHSLYWQDNTNLSGYIFSFDNCTGTLVNSSWVAMTGTGNWSNVTKTINSTVGCKIQWCVYANDTSNNWNSTSCSSPFSYNTTNATSLSICSNLNQSGATYDLIADIIDSNALACMNISANNVTLDCHGHTIDSDGTNGQYGVYVYRTTATNTNATVRNCVLTDWVTDDVYLYYSSKNSLYNNAVSTNNKYGFLLASSSSNNSLYNNTVSGSSHAIALYSSSKNNLIYNNTVNSNNIAFDITSNSNLIYNNIVSDNNYPVYLNSNTNNSVYNNTVSANDHGIYLYNSSSNSVYNNTVSNNDNYGIAISSGANNSIYNNLLSNSVNVNLGGITYLNFWNTTNRSGTRIYSNGTNIGGNYWTNSSGNGYSDTCTDANKDGFCDAAYDLCSGTCGTNNTDYLPLSNKYVEAVPPVYSQNSTNSTLIKTPVEHRLYWQSNVAGLSGYIFRFDNCTGILVDSPWMQMTGTDNWTNVTLTINSTVGCIIRWCVKANDTSNKWNSTSCDLPFNYTTTVIQVPSNCSMTAIPFLTALSEPVDINVSYTNAADGSPITDAVCPVVINLDQYNPLHTTYNSTTLSYTLTTNQFLPGPNILNVTCNSTAFFDCNTSATHNVSWSGVIDFPSIIIQDPIYAVNSSGQYHKIIKKAPPYPSGNLVTDIGFGNSAYNWTYGMVTKPANSKPTCADINNIVDSSKILLVNDSSNIANVTLCPGITAFSGLIFADDACVKNATDCRDKLTVPYILNFTYNTTYGAPNLNNVNIFNLSNLTYVLLNGDQHVVQDVSGLRAFYFNGYYIESKLAPSFLMRLYGQFGPSPYGIYSFVDMNQYPSPNSSVDYYYFNKTSNIPSYLIKGMPNCENANICNNDTIGHFRLDDSISVLNSSGTYTHITSIGAEKLIYQP